MSIVTASPLDDLDSIPLDEIVDRAELLTRTDRKYVLAPDRLDRVLDRVLDATADAPRVLEIGGRRTFGYESVYLDTPALDSYLGAARRRTNRFKARTRSYVDSGRCMLEVKLRTRRGQTEKHRLPYAFEDRSRLTDRGAQFLRTFPELSDLVGHLDAVMTTRYLRSTIVVGGGRVTIDRDVRFEAGSGSAGIDGLVVLETKSAGGTSVVDRALWAEHVRPVTISKFGVGMAALDPTLPANKWHRVILRHVHTHSH